MNVLGIETKVQKHIPSENYTNIYETICVCDKKKEIAYFEAES